MQIYMLNTCIETSSLPPIFPIQCHEKFEFKKVFSGTKKLRELDRYLSTLCSFRLSEVMVVLTVEVCCGYFMLVGERV